MQEKIAEVIVDLEAMRGFWARAERDAAPNAYGLLCPDRGAIDGARNLFPRIAPRISEIVHQIGASGMITLPYEQDFDSLFRRHLDKYLQSATLPARAARAALSPGLGYDHQRLWRAPNAV